MNKKSKMIAAVMLLAVSAAGLILINYYNPQQQEPEQHEPGEFETPPETPGKQATDSCENFTDIEKAKCYLDEDDLNASLEVCENMGNKKYGCYGRLGVNYAKKDHKTGIEICNKLPNLSDERLFCISGIAGLLSNKNLTLALSLCGDLSVPTLCYSDITRSLSFNDYEKALDICDNISEYPDQISVCYAGVATGAAYKNVDIAVDICENLESAYYPGCMFEIAGVVAKSDVDRALEICGNSTSFCYYEVAVITSDVDVKRAADICKEFYPDNAENMLYVCNRMVASRCVILNKENINFSLSLCKSLEKFENEGIVDDCYRGVAQSYARKTKNINASLMICEGVTGKMRKNWCYGEVKTAAS